YVGIVFLLLIPIAGVLATSGDRRHLVAGGVFAVIGLAAGIRAVLAAGEGSLQPAGTVAAAMMIYYVFTTRRMFLHLMGAKRVTQDTLVSAACVYLLVGLTFAFAYMWVQIDVPGAFIANTGESLIELPNLIYFSFVTLTTLGYGDIAPVAGIARSLVILEATFGVMYLATIISRMVSLYSSDEASTQ
ncbi:MAG: potassium channel family protein, partial [Candidatus Krumholzibacteria bacterium]|nr:potassium channel family protein [Candidatus Krumholzibacteria bacterium]